jgi:hypothetical protein
MAPFAADWETPAEAELASGPCHGLVRLMKRKRRMSLLGQTECARRQFFHMHTRRPGWVMYGRRPRCKGNLTISEAFGCSHVSGL